MNDLKRFRLERDLAQKALKLAEFRMVTFVGDLADVRDSLRSYEAAENGLSTAEVEVYRSRLAHIIVNGGSLGQ